MEHIIDRMQNGSVQPEQVGLLMDVANEIRGKCLCALGEFSIMAVTTGVQQFAEDFGS